MYKNTRTYFLFVLLIPFCSSCKKFIDVKSPDTQIETAEIFQNDQSAVSAISGLYTRLLVNSKSICNGGMTIFGGLSADELINTNTPSPEDEFRINALTVNNQSIAGSTWQPAYVNIYQANAILEGLGKSTITESLKKQLRGEALVVRSLNYFYLVNLFGDVPLVLSTNYEENQTKPRTSIDKVYEQIIADLSEAKTLLNTSYPSSGQVRPNKFTASALLARVYLYLKDWNHAETESSAIITSGSYSLQNDLTKIFLANSSETIWSLVRDKANTTEGETFIPAFSFIKPGYILTDTLLRSFEAGDQRKVKWLNTGSINGVTVYYPYKYKKGYDFSSNPPAPTEYLIVFRLTEQYLIRAEARAQLNNISGSQSDINLIRTRAGLPNTIAADKLSLLSAVEHERQLELFAEWGHRWLDLKRMNRAGQVLSLLKGANWQTSDVLYPIPFDQLQKNPLLTQNAGY